MLSSGIAVGKLAEGEPGVNGASRDAAPRRACDAVSTELCLAALPLALEALSRAAVVVRGGRIVLANAAALAVADRRTDGIAAFVGAARRADPALEAVALGGEVFLVVARDGGMDVAERVTVLARRRGLTLRQAQVLTGIVSGRTNAQIAADLGIASGTAALHVSAVLKRLGCASRTGAVARVWEEP